MRTSTRDWGGDGALLVREPGRNAAVRFCNRKETFISLCSRYRITELMLYRSGRAQPSTESVLSTCQYKGGSGGDGRYHVARSNYALSHSRITVVFRHVFYLSGRVYFIGPASPQSGAVRFFDKSLINRGLTLVVSVVVVICGVPSAMAAVVVGHWAGTASKRPKYCGADWLKKVVPRIASANRKKSRSRRYVQS